MFQPPFVNIIDPTASKLRAVDNGFIFLGKEDTDPTIKENQIPVYYTDENGNTQQLSQPIQLNATGVPVISKSNQTIINPIFYADVVSIVIQKKNNGQKVYSNKSYPALNDYFTHLFSAAGYVYIGQWAPNIQIPAMADRVDGYALWESSTGNIIVPAKDESFVTGATFKEDLDKNLWVINTVLTNLTKWRQDKDSRGWFTNPSLSSNSSAFQAIYDSVPAGTVEHFYVNERGTYNIATPVNKTGGDIFWHFNDGVEFTGSLLPDEQWFMKKTRYGYDLNADIHIGTNRGVEDNFDANGGIVFGGATSRLQDADRDGIRFEGEASSAHNMVMYNTRFGGQTQFNFQCIPIYGLVNVAGTKVNFVSGINWKNLGAAQQITINRVTYEIQSIQNENELTIFGDAGTITNGKFRISTVYLTGEAAISDKTVTFIRGENVASGYPYAFIDNVRYTVDKVIDRKTFTVVETPPQGNKRVYLTQGDDTPVAQRIQVQPGANEQSMVWGYRESVGYFFSSITTGEGEHRSLMQQQGDFYNVVHEVDGTSYGNVGFSVSGANGVKARNGANVNFYKNAHSSTFITDNNVADFGCSRNPGGNGGIAFSAYNDDVYAGTWLYIDQDGNFLPTLGSNSQDIGSSTLAFDNIHANNNVIQPSDVRLKTEFHPISDNECKFASELEIVKFKFKSAIKEKGQKARFHYGVKAQQVEELAIKYGIDVDTFGPLCIDRDEDIYMIRYQELQMILIESIRRKIL